MALSPAHSSRLRFHRGTVLLVLLVAAGLLECQGGTSRRRSRKGKKRSYSRNGDRNGETDQERRQRERKPRTKAEEAVKNCGDRAPLPPELSEVAGNEIPSGEHWRYLLQPQHGQLLEGGVRFVQVEWTEEREQNCRELFVGQALPTRSAEGRSVFTCVLSSSEDGVAGHALYAADYNVERGLPNFVAFVLPRDCDEAVVLPPAEKEPARAAVDLDVMYAPGKLEACCWCTEGNGDTGRYGGGKPSSDCGADADGRGHFIPLNAFRRPAHAAAADIFLNTVPLRRAFLEQQWLRKLRELWHRARFIGGKTGRRLHILMGPSLQTDGELPTIPPSNQTVEVPSFMWMAYADPFAIAAGGNMCRNGGPDDNCSCVDNLRSLDIEQRLGFRLFPGMQSTPHDLNYYHTGVHHTEFLWAGAFVFIVMGVVALLFLVVFPEGATKKESSREKNRNISAKALREAARGHERMRRELESTAGGREALRARFRAV